MSIKGLLVDGFNTMVDSITTIFTRMGDEATPTPGDETLQRQHKSIEALLATITGSYKSSEDIIPEEHTITRLFTAPVGARSFTFDESGYLVVVKSINDYSKIDLSNNVVVSTGTLDKNNDTWNTRDLISIRRCGTSYAVAVRNYAGTLNKIYIYSQALAFTRKWDVTDSILGIAWNGTNIAILTTKVPEGGFGYQNTITYYNLEGEQQGSAKVDQRNISVLSKTTLNSAAVKQELFFDNGTFYFPKIMLAKPTGAIWGMTENGFLTRILKFSDMTGILTKDVTITAIDYYQSYLYMLMNLGSESVIGMVKIND